MTEADWLTCNDPRPMLGWVSTVPIARERGARLFACACVRQVWNLIPDSAGQRAVETAERFVDGLATVAELRSAERSIEPTRLTAPEWSWNAELAAGFAATLFADPPTAWDTAWNAAAAATLARQAKAKQDTRRAGGNGRRASEAAGHTERRRQSELLRDILGPLPFRAVAVDPTWQRWNYSTIAAIARHVYEGRAFHDLLILADALEDAGCTDTDILGHCRQGGEHVPGCWVVDLLLEKQ